MRTGIDARTGEVLTGWDHCVQSIDKCLRTTFNSRVMRRHLGSLVPTLQDQNPDPVTLLKLYSAIADALNDEDGGEPGFSLSTVEMVEYGRSGRFAFRLLGDWFPRGHLGDYSVSERVDQLWVAA